MSNNTYSYSCSGMITRHTTLSAKDFSGLVKQKAAAKINALRELSAKHIQAILDTQKLAQWRRYIFEAELKFRKQIC